MIMQDCTFVTLVMEKEVIVQNYMCVRYEIWISICGSYLEGSCTYIGLVRKGRVQNFHHGVLISYVIAMVLPNSIWRNKKYSILSNNSYNITKVFT